MKTSESKPTKEDVLKRYGCTLNKIKLAMQEYAESYHKEKLKNDLIHFASQRNEQHFLDWESKYMITVNEINDFLNTMI